MNPPRKSLSSRSECAARAGAKRVRLAMVDHQASVCGFFSEVISQRKEYEFVGQGSMVAEALVLCRTLQPDVLVMEYFPGKPGTVEVIETLRAEQLPMRVLVFTGSRNVFGLAELQQARPHGIVHKDEPDSELWAALEMVVKGGTTTSARINQLLTEAVGKVAREPLTEREVEVWRLAAMGLCNKEIAQQLRLSPKTTEHHRNSLMRKHGVHDVVSLTRLALQKGLVE